MDARPSFCTSMEMGEPRVEVTSLIELHRLLTERGFRQTSTDGLTAIQKARHEDIAITRDIANTDPTTEHTVRYTADAGPERYGTQRRCHQAGKLSDGHGGRRDEGGKR